MVSFPKQNLAEFMSLGAAYPPSSILLESFCVLTPVSILLLPFYNIHFGLIDVQLLLSEAHLIVFEDNTFSNRVMQVQERGF